MKLVYTKVADKFLNVFNGSLRARPAFERLELFKPIKKNRYCEITKHQAILTLRTLEIRKIGAY